MFLFFSVSVEECAFKAPTKYGTHRWTPGGNVMMAHSDDNGDTWSEPQVQAEPVQTGFGNSSILHHAPPVLRLLQCCSHQALRQAHTAPTSFARLTTTIALQTVLDFEAEGGVPKVIANKLAIGTDGGWLLPFWRENE